MNSTSGIWNALNNAILVLLFFAVLVSVAVWYSPLVRQNETMRAEILRLKREIAQEEERARDWKTAIDLVRNDRKAQERLIRENLGYARPGEVVFRFVEPAVTPVPPVKPAH